MRFLHLSFTILIFAVVVTPTQFTHAQNVLRIEEEQKDKERDLKLQEFLNRRKKEEDKVLESPLNEEDYQNKNLVEVEPLNVLPSDLATVSALVPYNVRRKRWGDYFNLTYSQYHPLEYQTDHAAIGSGSFDYYYGTAQMPLLELSYTRKFNFALGSLGGELGYGYYVNDSKETLGDATLTLQLARIGLRFTLDNIIAEPYIAPYVLGGAYVMMYDETLDNVSFNGNTSPAIYYGLGVLFQLNWLDRTAAVESYVESEIENTFLFAEVRQYQASSTEKDPDFSNESDLNAGITVEF